MNKISPEDESFQDLEAPLMKEWTPAHAPTRSRSRPRPRSRSLTPTLWDAESESDEEDDHHSYDSMLDAAEYKKVIDEDVNLRARRRAIQIQGCALLAGFTSFLIEPSLRAWSTPCAEASSSHIVSIPLSWNESLDGISEVFAAKGFVVSVRSVSWFHRRRTIYVEVPSTN